MDDGKRLQALEVLTSKIRHSVGLSDVLGDRSPIRGWVLGSGVAKTSPADPAPGGQGEAIASAGQLNYEASKSCIVTMQ